MNIENSFNNLINSNIEVNLPEHKVLKQLTLNLGKSTLIGREKELQEIDEQLKASKTLLVKHGKSKLNSF